MDLEELQDTVDSMLRMSDEECVAMLRQHRYGGPTPAACAACGCSRFRQRKDDPRTLVCRGSGCSKSYSVTAGTALHRYKKPLCHVFVAVLLLTQPASISTNRLAQILKVQWATAAHLTHRVRTALLSEMPDLADDVRAYWASVRVRPDRGERNWDAWQARNNPPGVRLVALVDSRGACVIDITRRDPEYPLKHLVERCLPGVEQVFCSDRNWSPTLAHIKAVLKLTHQHVSRRWLRLYLRALAWHASAAPDGNLRDRALRALMGAPPRTYAQLRPARIPVPGRPA